MEYFANIKPLFYDKINRRETINFIDNEIILSKDEEIAETFNKYFCNIAKNISLSESPSIKEPSAELFTNPVILALENIKIIQA